MKMSGCSYVVPSKKVTNKDLIDEILDRNKHSKTESELEKLEKKLNEAFKIAGTNIRYQRKNGEKAGDLTEIAGRKLLKETNTNPNDVDMLIYVGVGRGCIEPSMSNIFIDKLKLKNATGFDVLDACASWLRSAEIARTYIDSGICQSVMILNSEFNFREYANFTFNVIEDVNHLYPAFTIGEAATATLFTKDDNADSFYFTFNNWSAKHHLCMIPLPNIEQYTTSNLIKKSTSMKFYADSEKLTRFTVSKLLKHYKNDKYLSQNKYDIVYGHASSEASSTYWMKHAGLDINLLYRTHANFGNTVSASIPLAISRSIEEEKLKRGSKALIVIGSAGVVTAYSSFVY